MNILDPMKPERMYRLDLRRHDHREYAKILAYLAVYEAVRRFLLLYICMYVLYVRTYVFEDIICACIITNFGNV